MDSAQEATQTSSSHINDLEVDEKDEVDVEVDEQCGKETTMTITVSLSLELQSITHRTEIVSTLRFCITFWMPN